MQKIHVLAGGASSEREVSLRSGAAVAAALMAAGYDVDMLDPSAVSLDQIVDCDVVFPALHGSGGEDGKLQVQLESRNARFVGSNSKSSSLCFDKWRYRELMQASGLPMARAALVQADTYPQNEVAQAPYVLKPVSGGSSIDTFIVRNPASPPAKDIAATLRRHSAMLIEQLIVGTELTVGVLGDTALPVVEIIPPQDGEFDYENKYNGATQELCPPAHIDADIQAAAQALALRAHRLAGCRHLSRTDIMCDTGGNLFILETNTLPGMTDRSLFPKAAQATGMSMTELCDDLVQMAANR